MNAERSEHEKDDVGHEAIARGAREAGPSLACSYPGTPSSEILAELTKYKEICTD